MTDRSSKQTTDTKVFSRKKLPLVVFPCSAASSDFDVSNLVNYWIVDPITINVKIVFLIYENM